MKLVVQKREGARKAELSAIRHRGDIPAILYSEGKEGQKIVIDGSEFQKHLRSITLGHLPVTVFDVAFDGKEMRALVKDIQYEPTSYKIEHIDLMELKEKRVVTALVPVEFTGVEQCEGIKLGGFLRQVMRHIKVRTLPAKLPERFVVDIADLSMNGSRRIKELNVPEGVEVLAKKEEVIVVIAKR